VQPNRRRRTRSLRLSPTTKFLWFVAAGLLVSIAVHAFVQAI
jgi:energy-coupling factor transporter transmembrane protein EcfT